MKHVPQPVGIRVIRQPFNDPLIVEHCRCLDNKRGRLGQAVLEDLTGYVQ
jgi:hypothetical protein